MAYLHLCSDVPGVGTGLFDPADRPGVGQGLCSASAGPMQLDSVASVASRAFVRSNANPADYVVGLMYGSMVDFL